MVILVANILKRNCSLVNDSLIVIYIFTAILCCDCALLVLVLLVPRNVFHVASALQSIVCLFFIIVTWTLDKLDWSGHVEKVTKKVAFGTLVFSSFVFARPQLRRAWNRLQVTLHLIKALIQLLSVGWTQNI